MTLCVVFAPSALLQQLLLDPFLEETTSCAPGRAPQSAAMASLKYAALKNYGLVRDGAQDARAAQDALQAYALAAAMDGTDVVLWCVLPAGRPQGKRG